MKRIAVFAHYDPNNKIRDYVIKYLKGLKEVAEQIIFVSDGNIELSELEKIKEYTDYSVCEKHCEYDFGSYKRGFIHAKENNLLNDCEELIFCNDSCYAPLFPFHEMFEKMSNKELDFWGALQNRDIDTKRCHIQSFFVVLKQQVYKSQVFYEFITSITHLDNKIDIIKKYECGMTQCLEDAGFKWDVYSDFSKIINNSYVFWFKYLIKEEKCCFLKRTIPNFKARVCTFNLKNFIQKNTNYDYTLIEKDIKNSGIKISLKLIFVIFYKMIFKIPYNFIKDIFCYYTRRFSE